MSFISKLQNIHRLKGWRKPKVLYYIFKQKLRIKLSNFETQGLEFYNCLCLCNATIVEENKSYIKLCLDNKYQNKIITLRNGKKDSDIEVFKQVLCWKEYAQAIDLFKKYFKKDKINIIDAGGNIGLTSIYFQNHFNNTKILCIEPDLENFKVLQKNLEGTEIIRINGAVWSKNCHIKLLYDFRDHKSWSIRTEETNENNKANIEAFTILNLCKTYNINLIDILKIDIEGAEKELFKEKKPEFLESCCCIAIEIHDEFDCRNDIYKCLQENDFTVINGKEITIALNNRLLQLQ